VGFKTQVNYLPSVIITVRTVSPFKNGYPSKTINGPLLPKTELDLMNMDVLHRLVRLKYWLFVATSGPTLQR
jgi:hypothetical protein